MVGDVKLLKRIKDVANISISDAHRLVNDEYFEVDIYSWTGVISRRFNRENLLGG